jgi:excinuclease UvrABC nuclease subunit
LVLPYIEDNHDKTIPAKSNFPAKPTLKYHLVQLDPSHPTLKLIQQIRDEAHRFAQKQHKKKREEKMFE